MWIMILFIMKGKNDVETFGKDEFLSTCYFAACSSVLVCRQRFSCNYAKIETKFNKRLVYSNIVFYLIIIW